MTKSDQRSLITRYAGSRLKFITIAILRELVTVNYIGKDRDADAEAKPFQVSIARLARRAGVSYGTIAPNLEILEEHGLLTIIKRRGTADQYQLHLSPMVDEPWETTKAYTERAARERTDRQVEWARTKRAASRVAQGIYTTTESVQSFFKNLQEENRQRAMLV